MTFGATYSDQLIASIRSFRESELAIDNRWSLTKTEPRETITFNVWILEYG